MQWRTNVTVVGIAVWVCLHASACSSGDDSASGSSASHITCQARRSDPILAVHPANIGCRSDRFDTQLGVDLVLGGFLGERPVFFAPSDAGSGAAKWGVHGAHVHEHRGDKAISTSDGQANTRAILMAVAAGVGQDKDPPNAARVCAEFGDGRWYLPARAELALLWTNSTERGGAIDLEAIGIDTSGRWYWSSTEMYRYMAVVQSFRVGRQDAAYKRKTHRVRCARTDVAASGPPTHQPH